MFLGYEWFRQFIYQTITLIRLYLDFNISIFDYRQSININSFCFTLTDVWIELVMTNSHYKLATWNVFGQFSGHGDVDVFLSGGWTTPTSAPTFLTVGTFFNKWLFNVNYIYEKPTPLCSVDIYLTLLTPCVCVSVVIWGNCVTVVSPAGVAAAFSPLLLVAPPGPTHPEYEAVENEESLQTGDHWLRLKPPRWRRHGVGFFFFTFELKKRQTKFTSQRPEGDRGGKRLRDKSKARGGSVVTNPDSLSWRINSFSQPRPASSPQQHFKSDRDREFKIKHQQRKNTKS